MPIKKTKNFYFLSFGLILFSICFLLLPLTLSAENTNNAEPGITSPITPKTPQEIAGTVIRAVLGVTGTIALVMVIYGGIMWMTSAGNEQRIKTGKDTLVWALIGLAVVFLSYTILKMVFGMFGT